MLLVTLLSYTDMRQFEIIFICTIFLKSLLDGNITIWWALYALYDDLLCCSKNRSSFSDTVVTIYVYLFLFFNFFHIQPVIYLLEYHILDLVLNMNTFQLKMLYSTRNLLLTLVRDITLDFFKPHVSISIKCSLLSSLFSPIIKVGDDSLIYVTNVSDNFWVL